MVFPDMAGLTQRDNVKLMFFGVPKMMMIFSSIFVTPVTLKGRYFRNLPSPNRLFDRIVGSVLLRVHFAALFHSLDVATFLLRRVLNTKVLFSLPLLTLFRASVFELRLPVFRTSLLPSNRSLTSRSFSVLLSNLIPARIALVLVPIWLRSVFVKLREVFFLPAFTASLHTKYSSMFNTEVQ